MVVQKALAVSAGVLLLAGSAMAFPYDPNPSTIPGHEAITSAHPDSEYDIMWGEGTAAFRGFNGNWNNIIGSQIRRNLLVQEYMDQLFKTEGGGPGGAKDIQIWTTPAFNADKLAQDQKQWQWLLNHPGQQMDREGADGMSMSTTHDEMVAFLEGLPRDNMTLEYLGEIPRGFPFPMMVFSTSDDRSPAGLEATGKPLVWIQGNVHGGEWSGPEACLAMAEQLAKGTYDHLLEKINVVIIPRINADGAKYPVRQTADTLALQWTASPEKRDLNRDHILLDHPVTRAMKKMLALYQPYFSIDMHERGGTNISSGTTMSTLEGRFGRVLDTDAGDIGSAGNTSQQLPKDFTVLRYNELDPVMGAMAAEMGVWMGLYREGNCTYAQGVETAYSNDWMGAWTASSSAGNNEGSTMWVPHHPDNVAEYDGLTKGYLWSDKVASATVFDDSNGGSEGSSSWENSPGTNGLITSSAFDPDAPYFIIQEAQYNPRNARNNNAMAGAISQLYENKNTGPTGNRGLYERRIAAAYVPMLATMTDAANRAEFWTETFETMRASWIEKGKTVSEDDMIAILPMVPKPSFWGEPNPELGYRGHDLPWWVVDITEVGVGSDRDNGMIPNPAFDPSKPVNADNPQTINSTLPITQADIDEVLAYDSTKAMKYVGPGQGLPGTKDGAYVWVTDESGTRDYQPFKFVYSWQGPALRERISPRAYIMDGPYAPEAAMRMSLNGIEIERLSQDLEITVEANKYNQVPYIDNANSGSGGWRNRDVTLYETTKLFKAHETYVVYMDQVRIHQITTYFEPDMPYAGLPCMFLPYMSVALGGAGSGFLAPELVGMEMPTYRYLNEERLPTYVMDAALPLINRGAVARAFDYPSQPEVAAIGELIGQSKIRVYNWDIQVHSGTDALVDGKFDLTLPSNPDAVSYMVKLADGTYAPLVPHDEMFGLDIATVTVADVATQPYTVDVDANGDPIVGGQARNILFALPPVDELIGLQVVEIYE